jgi:hypothetical protein
VFYPEQNVLASYAKRHGKVAFGLLKASPQGEGVHPSPVGTLNGNKQPT